MANLNLDLDTDDGFGDSFHPVRFVAIDTETTGLNWFHDDRPFSVSISDEHGRCRYFEWPVDPLTREVLVNADELAELDGICRDEHLEKVFHNANFDVFMLEALGCEFRGRIHDTQFMARVANNIELNYQLKPLAKRYLQIPEDDQDELLEHVQACRAIARRHNESCEDHERIAISEAKDGQYQDYWLPRYYDPSNGLCQKYCELDTIRTMGLFRMYWEILEKDPLLKQAYYIEMFQVWPAMKSVIKRGVRIDKATAIEERHKAVWEWRHHREVMITTMRELGLKPFKDDRDMETAISMFNPNSPKQLVNVLFEAPEDGGLGLEVVARSKKTKLPSANRKVVLALNSVPFVRSLGQYKSAEQAITTFYDGYLRLMYRSASGEHVLHPGFEQCGTTTFRFSCRHPNLQNIGNPNTSTHSSYSPRSPLGPRKGYVWVAGDYGQQELRIFAELGDSHFIKGEIEAGRDPNSGCANRAWGGRDNPNALPAAGRALDMGRERALSDAVAALWDEFGWSGERSINEGPNSPGAMEIQAAWLERFDYDIVKAEGSIGRKNARSYAKTVMFRKIYGGGLHGLDEQLLCTKEEAKLFMEEYNRAMPEVNAYIQRMIRTGKSQGFIINPYGRKLRVMADFAYKAANHMIQSTAACMMKSAIVRCTKFLEDAGVDAYIVLTIHDELVFEIAEKDLSPQLVRQLQLIMEDTEGHLSLPMIVEFKIMEESWARYSSYEVA